MPAGFEQERPAISIHPHVRSALRSTGAGMCLCVAFSVASAAVPDEESTGVEFSGRESWRERTVTLPAFPESGHLRAVPMDVPGSPLSAFIDEQTLSIGDDGVVRYVLVLRSPQGAENVFYEGIRCATKEVRSYAYGASDRTWSPVSTDLWAPIADIGVMRYRERLYRNYFCKPAMGMLPPAEIRRRLRYGN